MITYKKGKEMAILKYYCKRCNQEIDCDRGKIRFKFDANLRPGFEKEIICCRCGVLSFDKDEVYLTEIGQGQLTELYLARDEKELELWMD